MRKLIVVIGVLVVTGLLLGYGAPLAYHSGVAQSGSSSTILLAGPDDQPKSLPVNPFGPDDQPA